MKNILIIKTSSLGDIIHTYPVINYLHHKFPEAHIDWIVENQNLALVSSHPYIDRSLVISTKEWRKSFCSRKTINEIKSFRKRLRERSYDVVFDLQGNLKSGLVLSQVKSSKKIGFALKSVPEWPNILFTNQRFNPSAVDMNIRDDYLFIVTAFFGEPIPNICREVTLNLSFKEQSELQRIISQVIPTHGLTLMVCPGSAWPNKQLDYKTLLQFLLLLKNTLKCTFLFVWGSPSEQKIAKELRDQFSQDAYLLEKMSLPMLQNLMGHCKVVLAVDSLALHLCGTTSTPSFSVFGPSSANKYKPIGEKHEAFQGECPYHRKFLKRCPILRTCPTGACIHGLSGHDLLTRFMQWWGKVR